MVERKLRAIEAGQSFDSFSSGSDHDWDAYSDDEEEVYFQDERRSYDPEIATVERTDWLVQVQVLGLNPQASGDTKSVSLLVKQEARSLLYLGLSYPDEQATMIPEIGVGVSANIT
ncbi:hypothetical protein PHISP_07351 [Aspergillus sp. HF37]|nr:hypothetical protein PHISP_07351 [Aspergillus sp. HF37]